MPTQVVLDTDFLSVFLKIDRLDLVREFYSAERILVPAAVYREVSCTQLVETLATLPWIEVETPELGSASFANDPRLGRGEREAIALAGQRKNALILTNDNLAGEVARRAGLKAVDIPAFLLSCRQSGFLDREQIQSVIQALEDKDHYRFRKEILDLLLR